MTLLITLLPALLWGFTPVFVHFLGGKPIEQLLGTTYGGLVIGLIIFLIKRPTITFWDFFWCCIGGAFWSVGQLAQYHAYNRLSVSTTSPINSGVQLVGVNIVGVLFFGSWASPLAKIIGFSAVAFIIFGVYVSTRGGKKTPLKSTYIQKKQFAANVTKLILGAGIGYTICSTFPRIPDASGWVTFPSQTVGMFLGAVILALMSKKDRHWNVFFNKSAFLNIIEGFNSSLGTFFYQTAMMLTSVSTAFTLS